MKVIIPCAGYGTRLYPLTKNKPKALLPVGRKPIIEYILDKISEIKEIDEVIVMVNRKFALNFFEWKKGLNFNKQVDIFVNSSGDDKHLVSVMHDIKDIIHSRKIEDDLLIVAGDNLFNSSLKSFLKFAKAKKGISVVAFKAGSKEEAKRFGVFEVRKDIVVGFQEKPQKPKTNIISSAIYFFPRKYISLICNVGEKAAPEENIGHLIRDIFKVEDVFAYVSSGKFLDIGIPADYEKANKTWVDD